MNGYSVKIPLKYDPSEGPYLMNKDLKEVVKQNFKMLLLTDPGERIMNLNYGIGIRSLLFHNRKENASSVDIESRIRDQVKQYLPFIIITNLEISDDIPQEQNSIFINIEYNIPSIKEIDNITLILNQN